MHGSHARKDPHHQALHLLRINRRQKYANAVHKAPHKTPHLPHGEIHIDERDKVLDTAVYIDLARQEEQKNATAIESVINAANASDPIHRRLLVDA